MKIKTFIWVSLLLIGLLWAINFYFTPKTAYSDVSQETFSTTTPNTAKTAVLEVVATSTTQVSYKAAVVAAFPDDVRMVTAIKCESKFHQFRPDGKPLVSPTSDVGVMQINQTNWALAKSLKLDIFNSAPDNIAFGRIIYRQQGIGAWLAILSSCYTTG